MFLVLSEKVNYNFFSVKFFIKFYRYCTDTALDSVGFWDVENFKGECWGSFSQETCSCNQKKFDTTESLLKYTAVANSYVHKLSYYLVYSPKLSY